MFYRNSQQKHIDFVTRVVINLKGAMLVNCWNYRHSVLLLPHPAGHCGHGHPVESGSPRRTQAGHQGESGTLFPPAGTQGVHPEGLMAVRTSAGLCLPDRTLWGPKDTTYFHKLVWSTLHLLVTSDERPQKETQKHDSSDFQKHVWRYPCRSLIQS